MLLYLNIIYYLGTLFRFYYCIYIILKYYSPMKYVGHNITEMIFQNVSPIISASRDNDFQIVHL